jgi:sulfoxide reductase heme-binding subunit YedZ
MQGSWLDIFSTWTLIRTSGLLAYFFLFLATTGGLLARLDFIKGKMKAILMFTHQSAASMSIFVGLFHAILLGFDTYVKFEWIEIFIPFSSQYESFLSGLGTISFYLIAILLLSSEFMKKIKPRIWKALHFLSFPAFLFAAIHGIFLGTDTSENWAFVYYASTLVLFIIAFFLRLTFKPTEIQSKPTQRKTPSVNKFSRSKVNTR